MPTFNVQYASKLVHRLRLTNDYSHIVRPCAPILALCGDIGSPYCGTTQKFIRWCSRQWDQVLWVPGIEELATESHAGKTWRDAEAAMREMEEEGRLKVMNKDHWESRRDGNSVLFLGTTLWGRCPAPSESVAALYENLAELKRLRIRPAGHEERKHLLPADIENENAAALNWLNYLIDDGRDEDKTRPIVVLSYHAPSIRSLCTHTKYDLSRLPMRNAADYLMRKPVSTWIYGDVKRSCWHITNNGTTLLLTNSGEDGMAYCNSAVRNVWTDHWFPPEMTSTLTSTAPSLASYDQVLM
jgi:hypothetical protein